MVSIRNEKFVKYEDNLSVVRVKINVDSADELPETDDFSGKILYQGSTARDLSTGDLYALTSEGEWILQTAGGGSGTSDYSQLSNKPSINNVTLQGNKSLSDIGTYSKTEIDGMTEIETIDLIHDKTEDKYYFPAEKRYILEKHKPFLSGIWYDSTNYVEMCVFSRSTIYDDGQGGIDGTYTYQFGADVDINEDSGSFDYYTMVIDAETLEVTINNYNVDNTTDTFLLGAVTGTTVGGLPIHTSNYESLTGLTYNSYYFDVSLIIQGTFQNGDTIAVSGKSIGTVIIPAILYRNNEYSAINLFLLGTDLKTFSNLESGDTIYINHTIHKVST